MQNNSLINKQYNYVTEFTEDKFICLLRLSLSIWAFIAIYFDPLEPGRFVEFTYISLGAYIIYSAILYLFAVYGKDLLPLKAKHWIDLAWYLVFVSLSSGTGSIFFFFFFFPILNASFRWGFSEGWRLTVTTVLLFVVIGYLTAASGEAFELNRFLLRPGYLLTFGYLVAYWGGREVLLKRKLEFLRNVNRLSNPRFGVDQTVRLTLEQLRNFYDADVCLVVAKGLNSASYSIMKVTRDPVESISLMPVSRNEISPFLSLPTWLAAVFTNEEGNWWKKKKKYCALDIKRSRPTGQYLEAVEGVANLLEVNSLISLPIFLKGAGFSRFFIGANGHRFTDSNLNFMFQLGEQIMPVLQNIQILDGLASKSAERERRKISRDLHDSTIQPYLGLKFKLEGLLRKLSPEEHLYHEVEEVVGMVTESVANLRGYISDLKQESVSRQPLLVDALKQQAEQIMKQYSIKIKVEAPPNLQLSDRLAAEVFQMVSEGLSNIRRHTKADQARVKLLTQNELLIIVIENNNPNTDAPNQPFSPRSLTGRAKSLGGTVDIKQNGTTTVVIKIPI